MNQIFTLNLKHGNRLRSDWYRNKREHSQNNQRNDNGTDEY